MQRSLALSVLLWAVQIVVIVVLVSGSWAETMVAREQALTRQWMGDETTARILGSTNTLYRTLFVDTGLYDGSYYLIQPTDEQARRDEAFRPAAQKLLPWLVERLDVFWMVVYQSAMRLVTFFYWWPYALVVLAPAVVDGWVRRRIKMTNMGYTSPVRNRYALWAMLAIAYVVLMALWWPLALNPVVYPVALTCLALAVSAFIANLQKRI